MPKAKPANGIAADIAAMERLGMTPEEIKAKIMGAPVVAHVVTMPSVDAEGRAGTAAPLIAPQRMDQNLGPDPEVVRKHREAVAAAPRAVLEETLEVTLERREIDYVRQFMALTNAKRPNSPPINEAQAVRLIVKAYRIVDPDRALMEGARGRTAPAALPPGTWAQKTA